MQLTLGRLPWAAQTAFALGLSAACAVCFHLAWATPAGEDLAVQERALAKAHGDVRSAVNTRRMLPQGRRALARLAVRLQGLRGDAPPGGDAAAVLREMHALAEASGLWITGFKPAPPATRELVTEWSVALEFDGTYASLMAFLERVGDDPRLVAVSALRVRAHERPEDESTLTGACRLTTFVLHDAGAKGSTESPSQVRRTARAEHPPGAVLP
jgi:Tfp pilus assembly protein PilO